MTKPKVVVDTNVFISAHLVPNGNPAKVVDSWVEDDGYELILSKPIVEEIIKVLHRKEIKVERIEKLLSLIFQKATMVTPEKEISIIKDDPDDNKFLECAVSGGAAYIVSGDKHLLDLGGYDGIEILTPKRFLEEIEK
ncbi:putative toxin-antitoxin system toxin component, PIN family [bacterium]|nr:putative toxin-antitoxin system toxin component, PIN family [bacterium]